MIKLKNEKFVETVESHPDGKSKIAILADSSRTTMDKLLNGKTDLQLSSVEKLANYVGLDVVIDFVPKPETATAS
jgi:hypothetical protein